MGRAGDAQSCYVGVLDGGCRDVLNEGLCSELRGQRHLFWFLRSSAVQGLCVISRPPQAVERRLQAVSGLSPDGRLDGTAPQTGGTHQRSFVSACNRPVAEVQHIPVVVGFAEVAAAHDGIATNRSHLQSSHPSAKAGAAKQQVSGGQSTVTVSTARRLQEVRHLGS